MFDRFDRKLNYLRISVTDRCNLRCRYCMPEEGIELLHHSDILSYDEIALFTGIAVGMGIDKVRITGGEPLVRRGIESLVTMLSKLEGIKDLSMTTNGVLLKEHASALKDAGLQRVNISLDTVDRKKYEMITRFDALDRVLEGIEAAVDAGLMPVKINCVVNESAGEPDAQKVAEFCKAAGLEIRYIRKMDLLKGHFYPVSGGTGGNCAVCNRLRLTSDGKLKPCLFNDIEIDIRETGYKEALRMAAEFKPECGTRSTGSSFYNVGG